MLIIMTLSLTGLERFDLTLLLIWCVQYHPQDFTNSNGLNRKSSKSPRQIISSYSSSEKQFVTFTLAPVDGRHCRLVRLS